MPSAGLYLSIVDVQPQEKTGEVLVGVYWLPVMGRFLLHFTVLSGRRASK